MTSLSKRKEVFQTPVDIWLCDPRSDWGKELNLLSGFLMSEMHERSYPLNPELMAHIRFDEFPPPQVYSVNTHIVEVHKVLPPQIIVFKNKDKEVSTWISECLTEVEGLNLKSLLIFDDAPEVAEMNFGSTKIYQNLSPSLMS